MKERALFLARAGFAGAAFATLLGTISFMNGNWFLWAVNCVLLLACAACTLINYRLASRL